MADKMLAVVRVRGSMQTRSTTEHTLKQLHLTRKNHCTIIPETPQYKGMLQQAKDYITWGEISGEVLKKLSEKRKNELDDADGKMYRLNPPIGGFKGGIKNPFPKGALGNRKEKIGVLIEKML